MNTNIEHHKKSGIIFICLLILFSSIIFPQQAYNYSGTLSCLDGTPIDMSQSDIDHFNVELVRAPDLLAGYVSDVKNGAIILLCAVTGNYILKFMGFEIARFEVSELNDNYISNLPKQLRLPFNYMAIAEPNQTIKIYDANINLLENKVADDEGKVALKGDEKYFSNKILVVEDENGFPSINFFKTQKAADKGKFNSRNMKFSKASKPVAKIGLVHNIQDDIFYTLHEIRFTNDNQKEVWLLKTYNATQKKGSIHKLDFSGYEKAYKTDLYLDENGNLVIVRKFNESPSINECYSLVVSKNGNLKTDKNTYVYPYYRFKNNFVQGEYWSTPVFMGIALKQGNHNFTLTCIGFDNSGSFTSTESFQVLFDPTQNNFWRMDGEFNSYKETDPDRLYYPSGLDPESEINDIDLKKCFLSIDGSGDLEYSYQDPTIFKSIFYADWSSEAEKQEAMEGAHQNARAYIGLGEDSEPWRGSSFDLFNEDYQVTGPINMYEGPYPELRYHASKKIAEYPTEQEAKKHCEKPIRYYGKYRCVETSVISICPDNYQFSVNDGRLVSNYEALYCGE
ncbi:hypothetical protein KKF86_04670, partial [bacterium]|nr:hypothetical protein [bacterium]